MGWRDVEADGWAQLPVDSVSITDFDGGSYMDGEQPNEIVEAITERQTFQDAEDPTFIPTGINYVVPMVAKDGTVTGYDGADYCVASFIVAARARIEELIPYFKNPGSFNTTTGNWDAYTVLDLLPNGWEKLPDEIDQYRETPATRTYDPGGPSYGAVEGVNAVGYDAATYSWTEHLNQMRDVLNKLIYVQRSFSPYTDGSFGGLAKLRATPASGVDRPTAVDNWELGLGAISQVIPTNIHGWVPSPFKIDAGSYVVGITSKGYGRAFYYFEWTHAIGIVQIKTKVKLYSYYEQADGNHELDTWDLAVYHNPGATPGALTADDWDWGSASGLVAITGVYDSDWIPNTIDTPSAVPVYPGVGVSKYTDDQVYLQTRCREDQPDVLDAVTWPASPTAYGCIAYQDVPNGLSASHVCLVRVAFEYDDRTGA